MGNKPGFSPSEKKNLKVIPDKQQRKNSVSLVRERNIPTERPPLVGEVSANFCR
jgi:hypothetical protein